MNLKKRPLACFPGAELLVDTKTDTKTSFRAATESSCAPGQEIAHDVRFRLYVDESGDHTYKDLDNERRRYLGLTGIAVECDYYRQEFQPELEALKQQHFPHSTDDPVILHREDIYNRRHAFGVLEDPAKNAAWEDDVVDFTQNARILLFTVVLDKKRHVEKYGTRARHPYHYSLTLLLERYKGYLLRYGAAGDVLAEARGKAEDRELSKAYREIWTNGTYYEHAAGFQRALSSRELKLKRKEQNVAGLQLADLIAHPSKFDVLYGCGRMTGPRSLFSERMADAFGRKYDLYGRKVFP